MLPKLFSRRLRRTVYIGFPMFIYGGITVYSINYYFLQNNFKAGFRAGINELIKGDSITDEKK